VQLLTVADLDTRWLDVESALDETAEVDRWCSGPDWVIPVHEGFAPAADTLLLDLSKGDEHGFALLARYQLADGRTMIGGLEPLWGFASPLIGADISAVAGRLADHLDDDDSWDVLVLAGMPLPTGPGAFTAQAIRALGHLGEVRIGEGITRQVADLDDGYEAWHARRSSTFRRNLRQTTRRAADEGVAYDDVSDDPAAFDRVLTIEQRSWKGGEDSGITSPEMRDTYRAMLGRLASRRRLRAHVARLGGVDIGYILGGVRAGIYRGLQLSYVEEAASLSVGHLLQAHQLQLLTQTGEADLYDLGMDLDYKRRWADRAVTSFTVVIDRHGAEAAPL
jgi:CelD/BcsL family acetyltransferase involved in cellulose biosynthesis